MKLISLVVLLFLSAILSYGQPISASYHYNGEVIELNETEDLMLIRIEDQHDAVSVQSLLALIDDDVNFDIEFPTDANTTSEYYLLKKAVGSTVTKEDAIGYYINEPYITAVNFVYDNNGEIAGISNEITVKLSEGYDVSDIETVANNYLYTTIEQNEYMENVFHVFFSKNEVNNAFALANLFYDQGIFEFAEPIFYIQIEVNNCPTSDPYFSTQWHLRNNGTGTGIAGSDINVCDAWKYTKGSGIKVAVIDVGVELTHSDLNIGPGFDASGNNSGGGCNPNDRHGTICAGVIGALHNTQGTAGISPDVEIIPIRMGPLNADGKIDASTSQMASSILFGAQSADILSNSWITTNFAAIIDASVSFATSTGRNSLGSFVVFGAGNDNLPWPSYPGSLPTAVSVGASTRCDERVTVNSTCSSPTYSSNFGPGLSVVAPGVNIFTTTVNNSWTTAQGTSLACPQVAGIAALLLSVNPCLTWYEIRDIIEKTAVRAGNYTYSGSSANGPSNIEMGHGRANATAAIILATTTYKQNMYENNPAAITYKGYYKIVSGEQVTSTITQGKYTVSSNANITFQAGKAIELEPGFEAQYGSNFLGQIQYVPCNERTGQYKQVNTYRKYEPIIIYNDNIPGNKLHELAQHTKIYPNPGTGLFNIELPLKGNYEIRVLNTLGSVVHSSTLAGQSNTSIQLDERLQNGHYTVHISGQGIRHVEKITLIKQ